MRIALLLIIPTLAFADSQPISFPVFLKQGFSSVLDFEEEPTKVVLGDGQFFQIERLEKSLVVRTLTPYAVTNLFVYFKNSPTRLFVLSASEDAEPTYYKKFENPKILPTTGTPSSTKTKSTGPLQPGLKLTKVTFDSKKDYLTVEASISADSTKPLIPIWDSARLSFNGRYCAPMKLWAERTQVQKDSVVKARFVFAKPNIPKDLKTVSLVIPLKGSTESMKAALGGTTR
jgi:hypothetical protein